MNNEERGWQKYSQICLFHEQKMKIIECTTNGLESVRLDTVLARDNRQVISIRCTYRENTDE
jgi:hypothetical protein